MTDRDLEADFARGQRTLEEMTPRPAWGQRLGFGLCVLSAVVAVTGLYAFVVLPAVWLFGLVFGR